MNVVNGPAQSSPPSTPAIAPAVKTSEMLIAQGTKVVGGAAIGTAFVIQAPEKPAAGDLHRSTPVSPDTLPQWDPAHEAARANAALTSAAREFERLLTKVESARAKETFEYLMRILRDPNTQKQIVENLADRTLDAERAVEKCFNKIASNMRGTGDLKFIELAREIEHARDIILEFLSNKNAEFPRFEDETIIVAHELTPRELIMLNETGKVRALILAAAGKTSHVVIIAKSFDIPVISQLDATSIVGAGDTILANGDTGEIIINPDPETFRKFVSYISNRSVLGDGLKLSEREPCTLDGQQWTVRGTLGSHKDLDKVVAAGFKGIGLFRTEELFLGEGGMVSEDQQYEIYCKVLGAFPDHPVVIRTFDLGADKWSPKLGKPPDEKNPKLGNRGIRACFTYMADDFKAQARAILRAHQECGNAKIMFPMVNDLSEFRRAKELILTEMDRLVQEGVLRHRLEISFGPMIETPAAVLMVKTILTEADFISIGSNDLTQYTMAIDREPTVGSPHAPVEHHPAVIKMLHRTAKAARKAGKPVSLCGDMAGDTLYTPCLSGLGITEVSVLPSDAPKVNFALSCLNSALCRELTEDLRKKSSAEEALQGIQKFLSKVTAEQDRIRAQSRVAEAK